jgi:hypothetical protein
MVAGANFEHENAEPTRNYLTILKGSKGQSNRPSLFTAALRNSYGDEYAASFAEISSRFNPMDEAHSEAQTFLPTAPAQETHHQIHKAFATIDIAELPAPVRAKALEYQRRQQMCVSATNLQLPTGCHAMAWNIVPLELFQGELGRFLMIACDFHAYSPANTMLLPTMPSGAQYLNLPRHPLVVSDNHLQIAKTHITLLRDRVAGEHRRANLALQNGDVSQIYGRSDSKTIYCKELTAIVQYIARWQFGESAVQSHASQFEAAIEAM